MTQPFRLGHGGLIDRSATLSFQFDGHGYSGFAGDTLASALLANGVRLVGRSFKYHRPRGIFSAGSDEPNALVELRSGARREPNTRATTVELFAGLFAQSQNRWPSLAFDVMAVNQLFSRFIGAGFYYKTFMWPAAFWEKLYEPLIRRAAGLGRLAGESDPDTYEKAYAFCDVLIIGSGPSGLMAALTCARAGLRVIICEDDFRLGGRLLSERVEIGGRPSADWVADIVAELASLPEVRVMTRTAVTGLYDGVCGALERVSDQLAHPDAFAPRQRFWTIVPKQIVLAAGALERSIAFGGNDRPGVMLASAVRTYVNRFAISPGANTAIFTNNDSGWRTAADLLAAGQNVVAVIDSRQDVPGALSAALGARCRVITCGQVIGTRGRTLKQIVVSTPAGQETLVADTLAVSGGWNPTLALTSHRGARPVWNESIAAFVPGPSTPSNMIVAGAAAGIFALSDCLADGAKAGAEAVTRLGKTAPTVIVPHTREERYEIEPLWHVARSLGPAFVDPQNDVTVKDITVAYHEGFRRVEHLKRYTTLGMATDQGKAGNVIGLAVIAELSGRSIPETGTTVFRPPFTPVAIGALAGHSRGKAFRPTRLPPSHAYAKERGAVFVEAGLWLRAQWFPQPGDMDWRQSVDREVETVRNKVGICDVSTLGKIDIQGRDAGVLLDRVYVNRFSTLPVGKARYGLMLREDGFVMDDGTTSRLADDHYYMTTTTANAVKVMQHLEFCHQVLWPDLDVQIVSVSDQWAQYSVAGPEARQLLRAIVDNQHDISDAAVPYLAATAVTVAGGVGARLFRISFSGEQAYEIAIPARYGDALMRRLMEKGATLGAVPYGTEALSVMRIEKGHPAGNELNGQTTAGDLGLARMMSKKKEYIGCVMARRPALTAPDRPALVGFRPRDRAQRLRAGAHFLAVGADASLENDEGYMTSVAHSPGLQGWIGLGFLKNGPARIGQTVRAYDPIRDGDIEVEICHPVFVDPKGERLHG